MKRTIPLVIFAVLFGMGASSQGSGWLESFDKFKNYPYGSRPSDGTKTLPAPWEGTVGMFAHAGTGHDASAGALGPSRGWSWGHAFRPTGDAPHVGDALVAKVFLPASINYESVMLALTTEKSPGASGQFAGGAKAVVHINGSANKDFAEVSYRTTGPKNKTLGYASAAPHPFLPTGAWYDVRLILGKDRTITLEYKHVEMSTWIPVGALAVHDDFHPN
ncbi:MAG: hypothetical protein ACC645_26310, partial [Pirellulales bacterium]